MRSLRLTEGVGILEGVVLEKKCQNFSVDAVVANCN